MRWLQGFINPKILFLLSLEAKLNILFFNW